MISYRKLMNICTILSIPISKFIREKVQIFFDSITSGTWRLTFCQRKYASFYVFGRLSSCEKNIQILFDNQSCKTWRLMISYRKWMNILCIPISEFIREKSTIFFFLIPQLAIFGVYRSVKGNILQPMHFEH